MINYEELTEYVHSFIQYAIHEDIGSGDHSSLSCIPEDKKGIARLLIKQDGVIAGVSIAEVVFRIIDPSLSFTGFINDGDTIKKGDIPFEIEGSVHSILKSERLVLNIMQRMSGIATETRKYVERLNGLKTTILDTRKTTPGFRFFEKFAVRTGGGENHRMGLFDMILLKDNHIDYAGGIDKAISTTRKYLADNPALGHLRIEIEARTLDDVAKVLQTGGVHRIMLDNFSMDCTKEAVSMIGGRFETESSGNITLDNIKDYALCGVDFISVGALTHQVKSLDMSLKAIKAP